MGCIIWFDEAQFKTNGTVNRRNYVYWAEDIPHITTDKAVNMPGVNVCCSFSLRGFIGPFRFQGTVTEENYLTMLVDSIFPAVWALYGNVIFISNYHRGVRAYLDQNLPDQWIGRRGPIQIDFAAHPLDLTLLDFVLRRTVKQRCTNINAVTWTCFWMKFKRWAE